MAKRRRTAPASGRDGGSPAGRRWREGRRIAIDLDEVEELARLHCTLAEAAAWFGVSLSTMKRRLKEERYRNAWKRGASAGRLGLRRAQLNLAEKNATMAIFLGKQILGQNGPENRTQRDDNARNTASDRSARDEIARRIAGIASRGGADGDPEGSDGGGSR